MGFGHSSSVRPRLDLFVDTLPRDNQGRSTNYEYPSGWLPGINLYAQVPLFNLFPSFEALNMIFFGSEARVCTQCPNQRFPEDVKKPKIGLQLPDLGQIGRDDSTKPE